jgi:hypothetical protein
MSLQDSVKLTELVQLPALERGGQIIMQGAELAKLSDSEIHTVANTFKATVVYRKKRAIYVDPEVELCCHYDCWRPVVTGSLKCSDHNV